MLPAHIIANIREREARRNEEQPQATLELPMPEMKPLPTQPENSERGVVIIDL